MDVFKTFLPVKVRFASGVLTAALLLTLGCTVTRRIKVVDAATSQPLDGVSTSWMQMDFDLLFGSSQIGPTNLPPSGADGIVVVHGLHSSWANSFVFSRPGYSNVYAVGSGSRMTIGVKPEGSQNIFSLQTNIESINGLFLVPMPKQGNSPAHE